MPGGGRAEETAGGSGNIGTGPTATVFCPWGSIGASGGVQIPGAPAGDHIFKVRDDGRKLNEEQADAFHRTVYQLLFAANRARRSHPPLPL